MPGSPLSIQESDPFTKNKRNFIIIAHRAVSDGSINLKDLCGASGRWDGIARCITSALFLSHDMRRDTSIHVVLKGPPDPPKILSVDGSTVKYLNPDERACSALMRKSLASPMYDRIGRTFKAGPGIFITRGGTDLLLSRLKGTSILLDEEGNDISVLPMEINMDNNQNFILSDDRNLGIEDLDAILPMIGKRISVGPFSLHSYQAIIIVHNFMDRMMGKKST